MGIYRNDVSTVDSSAIHKDVPNEVATITSKSVLVDADVFMIEDSADSLNKKKTTLLELKTAIAGASVMNMVELLARTDSDNALLNRATALAGVIDSGKFIFSTWVDPHDTSNNSYLFNLNGNWFDIRIVTDGVSITGSNAISGQVLAMRSYLDITKLRGRVHVLASADLSANPVETHLLLNGIDCNDPAVLTSTQGETITYTDFPQAIGNHTNQSFDFFGALGGYYLNFGEYLDFSVAANVAKFIDSNNKPVDLGADGSTPTGTAPAIFLNNTASTFQTNLGSGGDFTVVNGPLIPYTNG